MVAFNEISNTNRVPGPQVEIDGSKALTVQGPQPHTALIVGLRLSTGSASALTQQAITGELTGDALFGAKSQLAEMCRKYKRVNPTARVYAMALDEDAGGTAATGTFPLVGTASADGTLRVRIGDQRVSISVASGTAANTAGAVALAAAINALERCPFSASSALGTVTITCRHKGEVGNGVTIEVELLPTGITCTPVQPASGATNPSMAALVSALPETHYDSIVTGLTDATSMSALEAEAERRWGPTAKKPCHVIAAVRGSHGTLTTYGDARNSRRSTVVGAGLSPTAPWIVAAQAAARDGQRCDTQPNRPRNGMKLPDVEAPKVTEQFDHAERNLLLYDGISTLKFDSSGNTMIERLITTYQTNSSSLADATYLSIETVRNLAYLYMSLLGLAAKYADYLLVPDGTLVDPGVPALSPAQWAGELVAWNDLMIRKGLCKDADGFAAALITEINSTDVERMDSEIPSRLVGGLVTQAMKIAFSL